jgi:ATP10 protein
MRLLSALVLGALLSTPLLGGVVQQPAPSVQSQSPLVFPSVSAYALNKSRVNLPADFAGQSNLLLLSFEQEQQKDVDTWLPLAKDLLKTNPTLRAYMLPVFSRQNFLYRWWENSSLRSGVSEPSWLEFTVPLYLDKTRFRQNLMIDNEQQIIVLLVDKAGKVLWRNSGPLNDEKKAALTSVLVVPAPSGGH